jgi:hypothetical protein
MQTTPCSNHRRRLARRIALKAAPGRPARNITTKTRPNSNDKPRTRWSTLDEDEVEPLREAATTTTTSGRPRRVSAPPDKLTTNHHGGWGTKLLLPATTSTTSTTSDAMEIVDSEDDDDDQAEPPTASTAKSPGAPKKRWKCLIPGCNATGSFNIRYVRHYMDDHHEDVDTVAARLEPEGLFVCGSSCTKGPAEGAMAHRFRRSDVYVTGHSEQCPKGKQFRALSKARSDIVTMAMAAANVLSPAHPTGGATPTTKKLLVDVIAALASDVDATATAALVRLLQPDLPFRPQSDAPSDAASVRERNAKSALRSTNEGALGRGNRQLNQAASVPISKGESLERVRALFPPGQPLPQANFSDLIHLPRRITEKEVREHIHEKPRHLSAGPSGISYKWFKGLIGHSTLGEAWVKGITAITQAIADGWFVGTPAHDVITASVITPISKGQGPGIRPIAVGEVIANIGRSIIARHFSKSFAPKYPLDFGLGASAGVEKCVLGVNRDMQTNKGYISMSIDCSNAFGNAQREAMREGAIACGAEELERPIQASYATSAVGLVRLTDGTHERIDITRGVRQGDSLGPAIFAVTILPILVEGRDLFPAVTIRSYHDDINICGPPAEVLQTFAFLKPKLSGIGLQLNAAKSNILVNAMPSQTAFAPFAEAGFKPPSTSLEMLGSIIGDEPAIRAFLRQKDVAYGEALDTLGYAMSKDFSRHIIFKLLRFCAAARNAHLFRTISPAHTDIFAEAINTRTTNAFYKLVHGFFEKNQEVAVPTERPICEALLFAPTELGGVGMPDARVSRFASFIGSVCKTAKSRDDTNESVAVYLDSVAGFTLARTSLVDATKHPAQAANVETLIELNGPNLESSLAKLAHTITIDSLTGALPPLALIHITSNRLSESATPFLLHHSPLSRFRDPAFSLAALMRVSYPFHRHRKTCALCKLDADESAVHDLVCQKSIAKRVSNRHAGVQNTILDALGGKSSVVDKDVWAVQSARVNYATYLDPTAVQVEGGDELGEDDETAPAADTAAPDQQQPPPAAVRHKNDATGKISHPDFTIVKQIPHGLTDGQTILVDVTITGPNHLNRGKALKTAGAMALCAEERKTAEVNARWIPKPNFQFLPFAVENTGGLGAQARGLIYKMLDIPPAPPLQAQSADAANKRRERNAKFEAAMRIKASITAAVWKGNHYIYTEYTRTLKAVSPPSSAHVTELA